MKNVLEILRINMTSLDATRETLPDKYLKLGGRTLIAEAITDEIDPMCKPYGPENKLIVCTGTFAGTNAPTSARVSVGAKSPLTGGIKEASSGGNLGARMTEQGLKLIVIEGKADLNLFIYIDADGMVTFHSAEEYKETLNYALVDMIYEEFSDKCAVMCCGPAGVRGYKTSCIMMTDHTLKTPTRAAGRGGLGSVLASKGVRAIVIDKPKNPVKVGYADKDLFRNEAKKLSKLLMTAPATSQRQYSSTSAILEPNEKAGILPVKNFRSLPFPGAKNMMADAFMKRISERGGKSGLACSPACVVRCSHEYKAKDGSHITSGLQYETMGLCGSNCMISDLDVIAQISRNCDEFGIDTIEFGAAMGVEMEAGNIEWGDGKAVLDLMDRILAEDTEEAKVVCNGLRGLGETLGVDRLPETMGQAFPAYDPRCNKGMQVTYRLSPMGADHTYGFVAPDLQGNWAETSVAIYDKVAVFESMFCFFSVLAIIRSEEGPGIVENMMKAYLGDECTLDEIYSLGRHAIKLEVAFNDKAGIAGIEELGSFFCEEKSSISGEVCNISDEQIYNVYTAQRVEVMAMMKIDSLK